MIKMYFERKPCSKEVEYEFQSQSQENIKKFESFLENHKIQYKVTFLNETIWALTFTAPDSKYEAIESFVTDEFENNLGFYR